MSRRRPITTTRFHVPNRASFGAWEPDPLQGSYLQDSKDGAWFREISLELELDGCTLAEAMLQLQEAAKGFDQRSDARIDVSNVAEYGYETVKVVVQGTRPATEEEISRIREAQAEQRQRVKEFQAKQDAQVIEELKKNPELLNAAKKLLEDLENS